MKRIFTILLVLVMALSSIGSSTNYAIASTTPAKTTTSQKVAWDLSAIYSDMTGFEAEFSKLESQIISITALRGKLNTVEGVADYYTELNEANRLAARLDTYAWLLVLYVQSVNTGKALSGRVANLFTKFSSETAFALPELFANDDSFLDKVAADVRMKPYLTWYEHDRADSIHTLSESEEKLLQPINQLRDGAYSLYGTLVNSELTFKKIKFPDGTMRLADENNYSASFNQEYTQKFRIAYANSMFQAYGQFRNTLAQNMQNYYTAVTQSAFGHKYGSALEADLASQGTPISVYDGVMSAANQAKPAVKLYFGLIKKFLGVKTLYSFETNTSIAKNPGTVYSYAEAQTLVKKALAPLGTDYIKELNLMLSSNAIDLYPTDNKSTGAFAASVPDTHPFVLLNYTNDYNSVTTMAHELGHAVHMQYAQNQESIYGQNVNGISTEVASILNEVLLSDYMIKNARTEEERKYYIAEQMTLLYNTFYTQTFFARFQEAAVKELENGTTLTANKLDELWRQAAMDSFGASYTLTDDCAGGWARIPHFYNGFYVYQYAVGIAAACNIAESIQSGDKDAVDDYLTFLKAGDSGNIVQLLNIAGVDISNGDYIDAFTKRFDRLVTEFKNIK